MEGEQKEQEESSAIECETGSSSEGLRTRSPDVVNLESLSDPVDHDTSARVSESSTQNPETVKEAKNEENIASCDELTNDELRPDSQENKTECEDPTSGNLAQDTLTQDAPSNLAEDADKEELKDSKLTNDQVPSGSDTNRAERDVSANGNQAQVTFMEALKSDFAGRTETAATAADIAVKVLEEAYLDFVVYEQVDNDENVASGSELPSGSDKNKTECEDPTNGNQAEDSPAQNSPSTLSSGPYRMRSVAEMYAKLMESSVRNSVIWEGASSRANDGTLEESNVPELTNDELQSGSDDKKMECEDPTNENQAQDTFMQDPSSNFTGGSIELNLDTRNELTNDEFQFGSNENQTECKDPTSENQSRDTFMQEALPNFTGGSMELDPDMEISAQLNNQENVAGPTGSSVSESISEDRYDRFEQALQSNFSGNVANVESRATMMAELLESSTSRIKIWDEVCSRSNFTFCEESTNSNETPCDVDEDRSEGGTNKSDDLDKSIKKCFELMMSDFEASGRSNDRDKVTSREKPEEKKEETHDTNSDQSEGLTELAALRQRTGEFFNFTITNLLNSEGNYDDDRFASCAKPEENEEARHEVEKDQPERELASEINLDRAFDVTMQNPQPSIPEEIHDYVNVACGVNPENNTEVNKEVRDNVNKDQPEVEMTSENDIDRAFDVTMQDPHPSVPEEIHDYVNVAYGVNPENNSEVKYNVNSDQPDVEIAEITSQQDFDRIFDTTVQNLERNVNSDQPEVEIPEIISQHDFDRVFDTTMQNFERTIRRETYDRDNVATSVKPNKSTAKRKDANKDQPEARSVKTDSDENVRLLMRETTKDSDIPKKEIDHDKIARKWVTFATDPKDGGGEDGGEGGSARAEIFLERVGAVVTESTLEEETAELVEQTMESESHASPSVHDNSELLLSPRDLKLQRVFSSEPDHLVEIEFMGNSRSRLTGRTRRSIREARAMEQQNPDCWRLVSRRIIRGIRIPNWFPKMCSCIDGGSTMPGNFSNATNGSYQRLETNPSLFEFSDMLERVRRMGGPRVDESLNNGRQVELTFFHVDRTYTNVIVEKNLRTIDLCELLKVKRNVIEKTWSVVETWPELGIERTLEDHEDILDTHLEMEFFASQHERKFCFRQDFMKFEFFIVPKQFFPRDMVLYPTLENQEDRDEALRNFIERHVGECPQLFGPVWLRDESSSTWKKMYMLIKDRKLYITKKNPNSLLKRNSDQEQQSPFAHLSDYYVYKIPNAKKYFDAPFEWGACLRPSSNAEAEDTEAGIPGLKVIAFASEKSRACWLSAMRLAKYGKQLRENYRAFRNKQCDGNGGASPGNKEQQYSSYNVPNESLRSRVAMDFTGSVGRIVEDPKEAKDIAENEGIIWRRRWRPFSRPPPGCAMVRLHGLDGGIHVLQPWFHSGLNRDIAAAIIKEHGSVDGVFLVRESKSNPGAYVLTYKYSEKVFHAQIQPNFDERRSCWLFTLDKGATMFYDLLQLIEFYQLNAGSLPTRLTHYVQNGVVVDQQKQEEDGASPSPPDRQSDSPKSSSGI